MTYNRWESFDESDGYEGPPLRKWQQEALLAWESANHRGVVEAVTGTGKSVVGICALQAAISQGGTGVVLVPTVALVDQWEVEIRKKLPSARIGRIAAGVRADLRSNDIIVCTVQSVHKAGVVPTSLTVLVADEVHRYGSQEFSKALLETYPWRLGLSGTFERVNDDGIDEILNPYFGGVVHTYRYGEALADDVVAPFHLAMVGVELSSRERAKYEEEDKRARDAKKKLVFEFGYSGDPREFFAQASAGAKTADDYAERRQCTTYMAAFWAKKEVLAESASKAQVVSAIAPALNSRSGTLVFSETKQSSIGLAHNINKHAVAWPLDGDSKADERRDKLNDFSKGRIRAICAPRILDEGIDVPEAEFAIVVSASRTRRQMVQRMGRVVRKKADGRAARIMILYVSNTPEDPATGGHESFLDEVMPFAASVTNFDGNDVGEIQNWVRKELGA